MLRLITPIALYSPAFVANRLSKESNDLPFGTAPSPDSWIAQTFIDPSDTRGFEFAILTIVLLWAGMPAGLFSVNRIPHELWRGVGVVCIVMAFMLGFNRLAQIHGIIASSDKVPVVTFEKQAQFFGDDLGKGYIVGMLGQTDSEFVLYFVSTTPGTRARGILYVSRSEHRWIMIGAEIPLHEMAFYQEWRNRGLEGR